VKYRYDHTHDTASIKEILKILTGANKTRDRCKATAPGKRADMVTQGLESLCQLVQQQPSLSSDSSDTESAYATTDSENVDMLKYSKSRDRSNSCRSMDEKTTRKLLPSPSTSRSPTPPSSTRRSRSRRQSKSGNGKKKEEQERNPTGCKHCVKHGGNGYAQAAPKNIPHDKCNFNPKYKGWRPKWVCNKLEIKYKELGSFKH
jgi:hypothetical protein